MPPGLAQRLLAHAADAIFAELRQAGVTRMGRIARALTERGIPSARRGKEWQPVQAARVLERLA